MDLRTAFRPDTDELLGISLCAGYAGLDLGLHIAEPRYRTVAFVERESHPAATLVARMEDQALDQALIWSDLRTFDGRPWRGRVHLVSAGYPCQPFSYAGRRGGDTDPRHLWPEVERIVDEVRPEWVWLENVEGHLTLGFPDVVDRLRRLGYSTKAGQIRIVSPIDIDRESGGQFSLNNATRSWTSLWSTLKAVGWTATPASFRSSPPVRVSFKHGTGSSMRDLISNPQFYELNMGWPIGWTAPEASVTGYAAWLRRSRGEFSRLLTSWTSGEPDQG